MFSLNQKVFQLVYMAAHRNAFWNFFGIFFAQYLPYLLVIAFLVLVYYQKGWRRKVYLFCEAALAIILSRGLIVEVVRFFYHMQRPFSFYGLTPLFPESGWSFPSGHASWFFALAMVVWYANRKWGWWYFVLTLIMGIARIYAGVHWPLDIIGGTAVGILSAMLIHLLLRRGGKGLEKAA